MMRLAPSRFDERLPAIMSDLGMIRYLCYSELPAAKALARRLEAEQGEHIANGVHLIVVRCADNSLVVGDSHHYAVTPDPFARAAIDDLILDEYAHVFAGDPPPVAERWTGTYASAKDRLTLVDKPSDALRIVIVTSGTGASTSFARRAGVRSPLRRRRPLRDRFRSGPHAGGRPDRRNSSPAASVHEPPGARRRRLAVKRMRRSHSVNTS